MRGATVVDAIFVDTDELYRIIDALRAENQNLKTEIRILKTMIG